MCRFLYIYIYTSHDIFSLFGSRFESRTLLQSEIRATPRFLSHETFHSDRTPQSRELKQLKPD